MSLLFPSDIADRLRALLTDARSQVAFAYGCLRATNGNVHKACAGVVAVFGRGCPVPQISLQGSFLVFANPGAKGDVNSVRLACGAHAKLVELEDRLKRLPMAFWERGAQAEQRFARATPNQLFHLQVPPDVVRGASADDLGAALNVVVVLAAAQRGVDIRDALAFVWMSVKGGERLVQALYSRAFVADVNAAAAVLLPVARPPAAADAVVVAAAGGQ